MSRVCGSLIVIGILLLSLLARVQFLPPVSFAHSGDPEFSAWAHEPPAIDGVIGSEWESAASVAFQTTGGVDGVLYVMNDALALYAAVIVADPEGIPGIMNDRVYLYFDNDHDGVGPESGDDIVGWHELELFKDCFSDGSYVLWRDTDFGGTSEGAADATNNGSYSHFEIMHPLNTVDDFHDFSLFMGGNVGFAVRLNVDGVDRGWWPSSDPSSWADIVFFRPVLSAFAFNTPMIEGKLSSGEWDDADKVDFSLSWGGESHEATLYVMNDYINLYLAFEINNEEHDFDDMVLFNFDNDHDGVKWSGDDQISVNGSILEVANLGGQFRDSFFPSPGEGPSERDPSITLQKDGVGAAQFKGPKSDGSYVFELAHPLNTSDDAHDFSLDVDDTVGFNVLYLDNGGGVDSEDGWPTFTLGEWREMADITIARRWTQNTRRLNLAISKIEVTQATQWLDDVGVVPCAGPDNSLRLAQGKSTAVRVYVDVESLGANPASATVYLYATNIMGTSLVQPGPVEPYGPLRQTFFAPQVLDRGNEDHTANFLLPNYWVNEPILLVAFVTPSIWLQGETNYTDNWMTWHLTTFHMTRSLEIGYYLIDYRLTWPPLGPDPNVPSPDKILNGKEFFEKVTPMPDLTDPVTYYPMAGSPLFWDTDNFTQPANNPKGWDDNKTAQRELLGSLQEMWEDMLILFGEAPDQIVGLYTNAITRTGRVWSIPGTVFIAHEDRPWSFAHEIGHNFGFDHSWRDGGVHLENPWYDANPIAVNSSQTYGYDTQENWAPNEPEDVVKAPAANDTEKNAKYGALMSYYDEHRWISPWEWEILIDEFNPGGGGDGFCGSTLAEVESSSQGLRISGIIDKDNMGSLRPIFQTPAFLDVAVPSGPYVVELRGPPPAEPLYYSRSFNVSFEHECICDNRTLFMLNVPFVTGTYSVSLWDNSTSPAVLLDKITASSNPPSVTVTYPNGGEVVGDSFNINWTASDADGDPLTFKLFFSNDYGVRWRPISTRLTGTSFHLDASVLPGGSQSMIRVVVSDGFHTSEDQSDVVFSVPLKDPMDLAGNTIGPPEGPVFLGDPVVLKGSAFDPEDGVLNGTALTWTSDLNGTLGSGRVLAVPDLMVGTHNITLTATDSDGNNSTDSFTITVELRNITVTQAEPEQDAVYQGQNVSVNFTFVNEGTMAEAFDVHAYAISQDPTSLDVSIGNQSVTGLPPDANITLTFVWNTTSSAPGNYTLGCLAPPLPGELYTGDNCKTTHVLVKIVGDINGDMKVDIKDIAGIAIHFGTVQGDPGYDPVADITGPTYLNPDGKVDIRDIALAAKHYGETAYARASYLKHFLVVKKST
ncbi:MAG: hypothetical protein JSW72_05635 [Candidatus Bathyarchaeota archaeon]|nr:MAG: hypothetical protein JSW72_05635 [Candidatus Bathyarchaeota archaeon]